METRKKLVLDPAELRVEGFAVGPARAAEGTVAAHALTIRFGCPETNFRSCPNPSLCNLC
jgi:hypothetical protein